MTAWTPRPRLLSWAVLAGVLVSGAASCSDDPGPVRGPAAARPSASPPAAADDERPAPATDPAAAAAAVDADGASPATVATSNAGAYVVSYASTPDPIPLNEPFDLDIHVRRADAGDVRLDDATVAVDGRMPHHRHGMNQRPTIESLGGGRYRVRDMLFHMAGRWELHVDVTEDDVTERTQFTVELR